LGVVGVIVLILGEVVVEKRGVKMSAENMTFCPYCGEKIVQKTKFCQKCGKKLTEEFIYT